MKKISFEEAVRRIAERDKRFDPEAYEFVRKSLDYTMKLLEKPVEGPARHVTGTELLEGVRRFALEEYGPMALRVLAHWGIRRTEDVGELVFNLVESGVLGRRPEDSKRDFANGYEFERVFRDPYRARGRRPGAPRSSRPAPKTDRKTEDSK